MQISWFSELDSRIGKPVHHEQPACRSQRPAYPAEIPAACAIHAHASRALFAQSAQVAQSATNSHVFAALPIADHEFEPSDLDGLGRVVSWIGQGRRRATAHADHAVLIGTVVGSDEPAFAEVERAS